MGSSQVKVEVVEINYLAFWDDGRCIPLSCPTSNKRHIFFADKRYNEMGDAHKNDVKLLFFKTHNQLN